MSIGGILNTSVSGMAAQSRKLSSLATNIANANTVGYKFEHTDFSALVVNSNSGGVQTSQSYGITRQGGLANTTSKFDLAINGDGFLMVNDASGRLALTRAGAFVPDENGNLVNAAGFKLLGQPLSGLSGPPPVVNGTAGLQPISVMNSRLEAAATTQARLAANLPSAAAAIAASDLPSANAATATSSARTSVVVYGNLGEEITLDVHYARTSTPGQWEVAVFDSSGRSASGGFPYASGPLVSSTLTFDATGQLSGPATISVPVPGGASTALDLAGTSQLAAGFVVAEISTDGNPPSDPTGIEIAANGIIYEVSGNGARRAAWQVALATVASPDRMSPRSGTVFDPTSDSGDIRVGTPNSGGLGALVSGALENSNVDLGSELTDMIESQRSYSANSKVFQTGAELMEILVNLKR
jgi:flagellar hook protein FlgE